MYSRSSAKRQEYPVIRISLSRAADDYIIARIKSEGVTISYVGVLVKLKTK
jgi:hypothetical protein